MLKFLNKHWFLLSILPLIILLLSLFLWPAIVKQLGLIAITLCVGFTILFNNQKHWQAYQQAECTREKMIRNLAFDIIGFLLTMGAAMYVGRLAGGYFGLQSGFWVGLSAGFLGGFVAAWAVRFVWGRLVTTA